MLDNFFIESISKTLRSIDDISVAHDFAQSFSHNQITCKTWLFEELKSVHTPSKICIIGSWYCTVLPYLLRDYTLHCCDIDPRVHPYANQFMKNAGIDGTSSLYDVQDLDLTRYDTIINTSCEHMPDMINYKISPLSVCAFQSNNYYIPEHTNCKQSLEEFIESTGITNIMYSGIIRMKKYDRYMVIGTR